MTKRLKNSLLAVAVIGAAALSPAAFATPFTTTSPTGGALPTGVTEIGGIVLDLTGTNGTRVVSQLAASSLYVGFASTNPFTIGTQTGFTAGVVGALGGGLASASVRITLFDGDTAAGNFDFNQNTLFLNGINFGNFSSVATQNTNASGTVAGSSSTGFRNNTLDTGFFTSTNAGVLASLFASLSSGSVAYSLSDVDPFDNFFDFTQGIDGGLVNVGQGPTVTGVPEPATLGLLGLGLMGVAFGRRRTTRR